MARMRIEELRDALAGRDNRPDPFGLPEAELNAYDWQEWRLINDLLEAISDDDRINVLVSGVYEQPMGGAGCCLHIVTDDGNWEQENRNWVLDWAKQHGHPLCIVAAEMLVKLSDDEAKTLYGN